MTRGGREKSLVLSRNVSLICLDIDHTAVDVLVSEAEAIL